MGFVCVSLIVMLEWKRLRKGGGQYEFTKRSSYVT